MQHQMPYTFSFLQWQQRFKDGRPDGKPVLERVLRGIVVGYERTRSKKLAFKTRTNWDDDATTQFLVDLTDCPEDVPFWESMKYAVVAEICSGHILEDTDADNESWSWFKSLPKPNEAVPDTDYFDCLIKRFPTIDLRFEENGFY